LVSRGPRSRKPKPVPSCRDWRKAAPIVDTVAERDCAGDCLAWEEVRLNLGQVAAPDAQFQDLLEQVANKSCFSFESGPETFVRPHRQARDRSYSTRYALIALHLEKQTSIRLVCQSPMRTSRLAGRASRHGHWGKLASFLQTRAQEEEKRSATICPKCPRPPLRPTPTSSPDRMDALVANLISECPLTLQGGTRVIMKTRAHDASAATRLLTLQDPDPETLSFF